jgi:hypothetical protein
MSWGSASRLIGMKAASAARNCVCAGSGVVSAHALRRVKGEATNSAQYALRSSGSMASRPEITKESLSPTANESNYDIAI